MRLLTAAVDTSVRRVGGPAWCARGAALLPVRADYPSSRARRFSRPLASQFWPCSAPLSTVASALRFEALGLALGVFDSILLSFPVPRDCCEMGSRGLGPRPSGFLWGLRSIGSCPRPVAARYEMSCTWSPYGSWGPRRPFGRMAYRVLHLNRAPDFHSLYLMTIWSLFG